ncbi:MAG: polyphosphate kinase 2 family protein, partial [Bacteroidota bacterium]
DVAERALWPRSMRAYQEMLLHTSTREAPWHVIPADHKWFARGLAGEILRKRLEALPLAWPAAGKERRAELASARGALRGGPAST